MTSYQEAKFPHFKELTELFLKENLPLGLIIDSIWLEQLLK